MSDSVGFLLWERYRWPLVGLVVLLAGMVGLMAGLQKRVEDLKVEAADTREESVMIKDATPAEWPEPGLKAELEEKLEAVGGLGALGTDLGALMVGIEQGLPEPCEVVAFSLTDGVVDVTARCHGEADADGLPAFLEGEGLADVAEVPTEVPDVQRFRGPAR